MSGNNEIKGKRRCTNFKSNYTRNDPFDSLNNSEKSENLKRINYDYNSNSLNLINSQNDLLFLNSNIGLNHNLNTIKANNVMNGINLSYDNVGNVGNINNLKVKSDLPIYNSKLIKIPLQDEYKILNSKRRKSSSLKSELNLIFKIEKDYSKRIRKDQTNISSYRKSTSNFNIKNENSNEEDKLGKLNSTNLINTQYYNRNISPYINIVNINIDNNKNCKSNSIEEVNNKNRAPELSKKENIALSQHLFNNFNTLNKVVGNGDNISNDKEAYRNVNMLQNNILKLILNNQVRNGLYSNSNNTQNNFLNCIPNNQNNHYSNNYPINYNKQPSQMNYPNLYSNHSLNQNANHVNTIADCATPLNVMQQNLNPIDDSCSKINYNNNVFDLNFDNLLNENFNNKQYLFRNESDNFYNINEFHDFFKND
jgi:hypothetical protein